MPSKYLLQCIQCGISPAINTDGERTYWGADYDDETDEKTKTLLGKDMELHKEGENVDETQGRKEAI